MSEEKITTNHLEEKLLERELKEICEQISKIGVQLQEVFKKYEPMEGDIGEELKKFLIKHLRLVETPYYGGYTTNATAYIHPDWIPDGLKKAILKWAVKDFIEQVDSIQEII